MGAGDPLVVGVSTRALVESACRVGAKISALDYFGDRDQAALVPCKSLSGDLGLPLSGKGLFLGVRRLAPQTVVYTSGLDNHPQLVASLASGVKVVGNTAQTLARAGDWRFLRGVCRESGIACPPTILPGETKMKPPGSWLTKPARGGGGRGVTPWRGGRFAKGKVAQAFIEGVPASAAILADGKRAFLLGMAEQLVGRSAFGAQGFRWCGNIFPFDAAPESLEGLYRQLRTMSSVLTRALKLKGACGLDLIVSKNGDDLKAHLIEVNPRPTASMELMEAALNVNIYSAHLNACRGILPTDEIGPPPGFWGKAVVFARKDLALPCTDDWFEKRRKDIPFSGQSIGAGAPVCTVLKKDDTREGCLQGLERDAGALRQEIKDDISK